MDYTINRTFNDAQFPDVVSRTKEALSDEGFGVLTEIDVKATMKKKLDVDVDDYLILGACNPGMAHKALELEPRIGAMLPCNVVVRSTGKGVIEVSAIDPQMSMQAVDNDQLKDVAGKVRDLLEAAVAKI